MNKIFLKIIIIVLIITSVGYYLKYVSQAPTKETATPTPTPVISSADAMKNIFIKKYNWDISKINLSVKKEEGDYASGGVNNTDEPGGAMWFAAKVNGSWQLVFDSNGIITCDALTNYPQYPTTIIPQCFDKTKNEMVKR